jgi:hypothetical protein
MFIIAIETLWLCPLGRCAQPARIAHPVVAFTIFGSAAGGIAGVGLAVRLSHAGISTL